MRQLQIGLLFAVITCMGTAAGQAAEEKFDPAAALKTQIDEMIKLLEEEKYEALLIRVIPPSVRKEMFDEKGKPSAEFIEQFKKDKAEDLLKALSATKGLTPEWNEDKTIATYTFDEKLRKEKKLKSRPLKFTRADPDAGETWYIMN